VCLSLYVYVSKCVCVSMCVSLLVYVCGFVCDSSSHVAAKARIACFDIVEFMPERDPQGLAALTAARLVCNAIGLIARQR